MLDMKFLQYDDPAQFLEHAKEFLEAREAENNLILGITCWLATRTERIAQGSYFATVEEHGQVKGAAMMTPPYRLVLTRGEPEVLERIMDDLLGKGIALPGVNGPEETSRAFAELWARNKGCRQQLHRSLRIYQLSHVTPPRPVSGLMRRARPNETEILADYAKSFNDDIEEPQTKEQARAAVEQLTKDDRLYVWDDGHVCSVAAVGGPTSHGIRISLVYTPPELRGRGYGSALVAALSKTMLNSGKRYCYLFTDLSNPVSNRIYQRIGYTPVCDFAEHEFF
jgi:hypothetical protein